MNDDEVLDKLVEDGFFELHVDTYGRNQYRPTQRFYDKYPQAGKLWDAMIGEAIYSLWSKGFVEIEFFDEGLAIEPLPDESKLAEIDSLDDFERGILSSIQYMITEADNG